VPKREIKIKRKITIRIKKKANSDKKSLRYG